MSSERASNYLTLPCCLFRLYSYLILSTGLQACTYLRFSWLPVFVCLFVCPKLLIGTDLMYFSPPPTFQEGLFGPDV